MLGLLKGNVMELLKEKMLEWLKWKGLMMEWMKE